ncbi:holin-like protein [Anaerovirgula multivorans]|uniref:Holin-like protein n=1 Tax=Anaerovirgula multivorans TaxID=312168 RepID=A0A239JWA2_9FIRM|nr:CidA/LrgA family protein [Anaerovirgula multivorans]SNT10226.1 holin-like protein [Anaerovirgula multivorans]
MPLLKQLGIIVGICLAGELLNKILGIPVPGNVIGMIILLILLITGIIKLEMIEKISKFLLDHLAFFFVPAAANILNNLQLIQSQWLPIMGVILISTVVVMTVTGLTVEFLIRRWSV